VSYNGADDQSRAIQCQALHADSAYTTLHADCAWEVVTGGVNRLGGEVFR